MLLRHDVEFEPTANILDEAHAMAVRVAAGQADPREFDSVRNKWVRYRDAPSLGEAIACLEAGHESALAQDLDRLCNAADELFESKIDVHRAEHYRERTSTLAKELAGLRLRFAGTCPLIDDLPKDASVQSGVVIALVVGRDKGDREVWQSVRSQFAASNAVYLTPYEPQGGRRAICHFRYREHEDPEQPRRQLLRPNPLDRRRLLDERGQDLCPPDAGHYSVSYFLILEPAGAPRSLELLLRLAWLLASYSAGHVARHGSALGFWLCACPASVRTTPSLRITESDAMFDQLSQFVRDRLLRNCIIVHPDMLPREHSLGLWFAPTWRVPFQHRKACKSNVEWLMTTARFTGLPGDEAPSELVCDRENLAIECWGRPNQPARRTLPSPSRRGVSRLTLRRVVRCTLDLGNQSCQAFLLDYSPLGCRIVLPSAGAFGADLKLQEIYTLEMPAGLPWPWERGRLCKPYRASVTPVPRSIRGATEGPRSERRPPSVKGGTEVRLRFVTPVSKTE